MDLVYIEWDDAEDFSVNGSAWANEREAQEFAKKTYIVQSVGWLVKKTRFYLSIASDYDPNHGNYGTLRKVPRKMIKRLEILNIPQKDEKPS
jgi:hypothetical protein